MPVYVEISPLHRLVTIVARGKIDAEEIRNAAQRLAEARVRRFAKIVEIAGATSDITPEQITRLAQILRADPDARGPVAFIVSAAQPEFASTFAAETEDEGPIRIFRSLHEARQWIAGIKRPSQRTPPTAQPAPPEPKAGDLPADPNREATLFRGNRSRDVPVRAAAARETVE